MNANVLIVEAATTSPERETHKRVDDRTYDVIYIYEWMVMDVRVCVCVNLSTSMAQNEVVRTRPRANPSI